MKVFQILDYFWLDSGEENLFKVMRFLLSIIMYCSYSFHLPNSQIYKPITNTFIIFNNHFLFFKLKRNRVICAKQKILEVENKLLQFFISILRCLRLLCKMCLQFRVLVSINWRMRARNALKNKSISLTNKSHFTFLFPSYSFSHSDCQTVNSYQTNKIAKTLCYTSNSFCKTL